MGAVAPAGSTAVTIALYVPAPYCEGTNSKLTLISLYVLHSCCNSENWEFSAPYGSAYATTNDPY
jgi:hypothetical protein